MMSVAYLNYYLLFEILVIFFLNPWRLSVWSWNMVQYRLVLVVIRYLVSGRIVIHHLMLVVIRHLFSALVMIHRLALSGVEVLEIFFSV